VDLGVTAALLESIELLPVNPSVPAGTSVALQATGLFSDATTQDLTAVRHLVLVRHRRRDDLRTRRGARASSLAAERWHHAAHRDLCGMSATTTLTVTTATLVSISLSPVDAFVPAGYWVALQALGSYSDGSTLDLSSQVLWSSSSASVATISNSIGTQGRVTGKAIGTTTLSAALPGGIATTP
jgi:hypothetical protein